MLMQSGFFNEEFRVGLGLTRENILRFSVGESRFCHRYNKSGLIMSTVAVADMLRTKMNDLRAVKLFNIGASK